MSEAIQKMIEKLEKERFDKHIYGEGKTEEERTKEENVWLKRLEEAYTSAKQRGKVPLGIELMINEIKQNKVNWRSLLQKIIVSSIPTDFSWAKPSKKSVACGCYLPSTLKEKVDVTIAIDTSGSIGREELTDFVSEICGIAKAYQNAISMRLITHDCKIQNDYEVRNGSIEKIKALTIKGGGGTSHKVVMDYVKEKVKDCKMLICFTDAFSDLEEFDLKDYRFQKVFIISENGIDKDVKDALTIRLKERK